MDLKDELRLYTTLLADHLDTSVAACWSISGDEHFLQAGMGIDQGILDSVGGVWLSQQDRLRAGNTVRLGAGLLWPVLVKPGQLVGLLYAETSKVGDVAVEMIRERLSRWLALHASSSPRITGLTADPEKRDLIAALRAAGGNVTAAARLLHCSRQTVYTRCQKHGLDPSNFKP